MSDDEQFMVELVRHLVGLINAIAKRFWGRTVSHDQFMLMVRGRR